MRDAPDLQVLVADKLAENAAKVGPRPPANVHLLYCKPLPPAGYTAQVLVEEKLAENAAKLGPIFRRELEGIGSPLIKMVSHRQGPGCHCGGPICGCREGCQSCHFAQSSVSSYAVGGPRKWDSVALRRAPALLC